MEVENKQKWCTRQQKEHSITTKSINWHKALGVGLLTFLAFAQQTLQTVECAEIVHFIDLRRCKWRLAYVAVQVIF